MKGKLNDRKTDERRWSNHRGVCDHHSGCGWVCRFTADHTSFSRGQTDAVGSGSFRSKHPTKQLAAESGSMTAEFALVLPAVLLILTLSLSALAAQAQRMNLVELSAIGSRAIARGEDEIVLQRLLDQVEGLKQEIIHQDLLVCLKLSVDWNIFWLGSVPISEQQCSRKSGL